MTLCQVITYFTILFPQTTQISADIKFCIFLHQQKNQRILQDIILFPQIAQTAADT